MFDAYMQAIS